MLARSLVAASPIKRDTRGAAVRGQVLCQGHWSLGVRLRWLWQQCCRLARRWIRRILGNGWCRPFPACSPPQTVPFVAACWRTSTSTGPTWIRSDRSPAVRETACHLSISRVGKYHQANRTNSHCMVRGDPGRQFPVLTALHTAAACVWCFSPPI